MFSETTQNLQKARSEGDQHHWKDPLELLELETQTKNHYGITNWSRLSFKQQRSRISEIVRKKLKQVHKDTLINLDMQGSAKCSFIEGSKEFDWMNQLTGLSKSLLIWS
jgi:hypothetical protein